MKALIEKFTANTTRLDLLILIVPFILWTYCFLNFFSGRLPLFADAVSYSDHIRFYTDNLSKGVYPLWDPTWVNGAPNDFFLRRIGDVNPLFFLLVLLKWLGMPFANAYLIFLGVYYFLAGLAFYLIARSLLKERFFAFLAYILFLFSSWGSELFYNYIIIIFLPIIWFFYFLICFFNKPQKGYFLGICLCVGLVLTTYIPFFFLTVLAIFSFLYVVFYWHESFGFLNRLTNFLFKNKIFTCFCIAFLLVSCIPGLMFYKESTSGGFVLPNRHSGADTSSAVAVGIENVASGDIISHGYFDRLFDDHVNIDMGDVYIPYIFFLVLLCAVFARSNKLIFFLLFNILALSLITITSATGLHRFLYTHIFIFKFIRQIYYFFWLAMLPMVILLSVCTFNSLLTAIKGSSHKFIWLSFIIFCHLIFILFLARHQGVLWGAWASVAISLVYFLILICYETRISYPAGFILILLAVFVQSSQVYGALENKLFKTLTNSVQSTQLVDKHPRLMKMDLYYSASWFSVLVNYLNPQVFDLYRIHQIILYDNVVPYKETPEFFNTLQAAMDANANIAFVSRSESVPSDWRRDLQAGQHPDVDPIASGKISLLPSNVNTWRLKAHLFEKQFLVINDNYNADWHAFINGRPVRLLRANVSFKGLWVPPGDSSIVLRFSSPKHYIFHFGLIVLFFGTFIYLLALLIKNKKSGIYG